MMMIPKLCTCVLVALCLLHSAHAARIHAFSQGAAMDPGDVAEGVKAAMEALQEHLNLVKKTLGDEEKSLSNNKGALQAKKNRLDEIDKIWRIDKWRFWSDEKNNLRAAIEDLTETKIPNVESAIEDSKSEISRLQGLIDGKIEAHAAAKELMESIAHTQAKLHQATLLHESTLAKHKEDISSATKRGEALIAAQKDKIAQIDAELKAAKLEKAKLAEGGDHELQTKSNALDTLIADHEERIKQLEASIVYTQNEMDLAKAGQSKSLANFAATLQRLQKEKEESLKTQSDAEKEKETLQANLASSKEESESSVAELKSDVGQSVERLEKSHAEEKESLNELVLSNNAAMAARKLDHKEVLDRIQSDISDLKKRIADAKKALKDLKADVGGAAEGESATAAVERAVSDLKITLADYNQDKKRANDDLQRAADKKRVQEEGLEDADKWYKVWNWEVWSNKKANFRKAIAKHQDTMNRKSAEASRAAKKIEETIAALASHMGFAELAAENEKIVEDSTQEMQEKKDLQDQTEAEQAQNIKDLESEDKDEEDVFSKSIAALVAQIKKDKAELKLLNCAHDCADGSKHTLHEQWETLRNELEATITQREATINDEKSKTVVTEQKERDTEAARKATNDDFKEAIAAHNAQIEKQNTEKSANEDGLATAKEELAKAGAAIEARKALLLERIAKLQKELEDGQDTLSTQKGANKEDLEAKRLDLAEDEEAGLASIADLKYTKTNAEANLKDIEDEHVS